MPLFAALLSFRTARHRVWLAWTLLVAACIPASQVPKVAPSRTLGLAPRPAATPDEPFRVVFTGPQGAIDPHVQLNLVFNRPMRTLGRADAELPPPVLMNPAIEGQWRWVGTSALLFEPAAGRLPYATNIEVVVPLGVRALDGSTLAEPFRVSLETTRPQIVGSTPYDDAQDLGPRQTFELRFNQVVDLQEIRRAARLFVGRGKARKAIDFRAFLPHADAPKRVVLEPSAPLPGGHAVELVLDESLRGTEGPLPAGREQRLHFETYGPLVIRELGCAKGPSNSACAPGSYVYLSLSNSVLFKDLKAALSIEPALPITWESWQSDDEQVSYVEVNAPFAAGQSYTLHLRAGLRDVHGQRAQTLSRRIEFDDHWPRLEVGVQGDFFEPAARRAVPVASVNVPSYELLTIPLSPEQLAAYYAVKRAERGYEYLKGLPGAQPRRVHPGGVRNRVHTEFIDPAPLLGRTQGRGALIIATRRTSEEGVEHGGRVLQVTDLALSAKLSQQGSLVWVTRLSDASPVADAEVRVLRGSHASAVYRTDRNGLVHLPGEVLGPSPQEDGPRTLIVARAVGDWTYRRVSDYLEPWRMDAPTDVFGQPRNYGLLFTERGIYRPGDEVQVKGILRREAETGNDVPARRRIKLVLRSPDWQASGEWSVTTTDFGTFTHTLRVPPAATLGSWRLEVQEADDQVISATHFEVAEYRPTEISAKVASAKPSYVRGARASFEVQGDYLYGAPMAGAPVRYWAYRSETSWNVPQTAGFRTDAVLYDSAHPDQSPEAGPIGSGEGKLDGRGALIHEVPLTLPGQRAPEVVSFDAEVTDVSRQTAASNTSVVIHPADVYVGLEEPKSHFLQAPTAFEPRAIVTTPDGARQTGRNVTLELVRRRWTLARLTDGDRHRSEMRAVDEVVDTCRLRSAREPESCRLQVPEAGYYLVLGTVRDDKGRSNRAAIDLYALGAGGSHWRDDDTGRVELVADKAQYRAGETAKILVKSPFPEARALVTVEANGIFEQRLTLLRGPTPTVEVPIEERFRPNAYVSVHLLRPRSAAAPLTGGPDLGAPTYRIGHAELRVDPQMRRLAVALTPSARELRPGQELTVDVAVKDASGKPAVAEVTLYAVDEGVLSLVAYRTPDPLPVFTASRPLRTATLESRASLGRVVTEFTGLLGLGPDKGAAGGGGGEGGMAPRRDFRQSAYFNPAVVTAADGRARVKFRLPESLTTYRLMAVATSRDDRYGFTQDRVVTNKRLMARPALPRLLRAGDLASAGLIVSAKDLGPTRVRVRLEASGIDLLDATEKVIDLPRNGSTEVRFALAAEQVGTARFRFTVAGGKERDDVEVERPIASPATLEAVALYGETTSAAAEALGDVTGIRSDIGGLEAKVAPTALVGIDAGIEHLLEYPYGCTEQLASRLLPLLPLRSLAKDFGATLPANLDRVVEKTVAEIVSRQRGDGGFAMWPESADSSPWVSAYATWTLHAAKQRGFALPPRTLEQARDYLRRRLETDTSELGAATAPFLLDVLAELGRPDPGYMSRSFEQRGELPLFARAFLLHAMAISQGPAEDIALLTRELEGSLRIEANRAFAAENTGNRYAVLMDSPARTTALVLRALLAARPGHPLASRLARGLLEARRGGSWRSTQEAAFALLALDDYRRAQESVTPNFVARLWVGETRLGQHAFRTPTSSAHQWFVPAASLVSENLVFEKEGAGTLFYEARLRYARTTLPTAPLERGFFVQKTLRPVAPENLQDALGMIPAEGAAKVPAGGLVLADLLLVAPSSREYVVLDDPLPAGLEAVDARLATTARWANISGSAVDDRPYGPSYEDDVAHGRALLPSQYRRELRDDRVVFFIDHLAAGIYHYRYLARATTPGRFVVPPTRAEEMYNPEVFGRTAASQLEVE